MTGKSGRSRKENLLRYNAVTSYRSYQERVKATNGESPKHVSQGRKRTANETAPTYGEDYVNLGAADRCYTAIENKPFLDGEIIPKTVTQGRRYRPIFNLDNKRFTESKGSRYRPSRFKAASPFLPSPSSQTTRSPSFQGDYTISADVGTNNYATVVARDTKTGRIVYETTLSQRGHTLALEQRPRP